MLFIQKENGTAWEATWAEREIKAECVVVAFCRNKGEENLASIY